MVLHHYLPLKILVEEQTLFTGSPPRKGLSPNLFPVVASMGTELQDLRAVVNGRLNLHPQWPPTANQLYKPCPPLLLKVLFEAITEGIWNTSAQKDESCLVQLQLALQRGCCMFSCV